MKANYNRYNFSKEEVESAAAKSNSRTEMMRLLKIRQGGGGYQALDKWCRKYGVTPPDGTQIGRKNVARHNFTAMSDDEWFVDGTFRNGQNSKKRLIASGILDECVLCGLGNEWNGKPITLQVDHVNGDRWDNRKLNLRIVCPNCHSQTETYSNTGRRRVRNYCECGTEIGRDSTYCRSCSPKKAIGNRKQLVEYPPVEELIVRLRGSNYSRLSRELDCSDNAIRKYLERNGYDPKTLDKTA